MDSSLPGSSVHGILQARILEWVAIPFTRESSPPSDRTCVSCIAGRLWSEPPGKPVYSLLELKQNLYPAFVCYVELLYSAFQVYYILLFILLILLYFIIILSFHSINFWEFDIETPTKNLNLPTLKNDGNIWNYM